MLIYGFFLSDRAYFCKVSHQILWRKKSFKLEKKLFKKLFYFNVTTKLKSNLKKHKNMIYDFL